MEKSSFSELVPLDSLKSSHSVLCPAKCSFVTVGCLNRVNLGPLHWSLPGSSVHGISLARILEHVAVFFSSGSSQPGIKPASAGGFFTTEPFEDFFI